MTALLASFRDDLPAWLQMLIVGYAGAVLLALALLRIIVTHLHRANGIER